MDADEALDELIERFEFQVEAALTIYGTEDLDTLPAVQAFKHAIRMAQALQRELWEAAE